MPEPDDERTESSALQSPAFRSFLGFLAGLPLTMFVVWLVDPLLEPVRQSRHLRMIVFPALMGWIMIASGYGIWLALGRQVREIKTSPSATGGTGSGCMMALNGMILLLVAIMLVVFFATE